MGVKHGGAGLGIVGRLRAVCACVVVRWANIGRAVWIIFLWADQPIRKYIQTGEHCPGRDAPAGPLEAPGGAMGGEHWELGGRFLSGDPRGIRGGSAGDPRGIRMRFGGSAMFS